MEEEGPPNRLPSTQPAVEQPLVWQKSLSGYSGGTSRRLEETRQTTAMSYPTALCPSRHT